MTAPIPSFESANLRQTTLKDTEALVQLYNHAREGGEETEASMLGWLESGGGLLLEDASGNLLCAIRWREEGRGWRVDRIATLPKARGQGFGRWLMTKVEALAIRTNIPTLTLTLDEVRADLLHYYERMGYRVLEQGESEVTLSKQVGGMWQYQG